MNDQAPTVPEHDLPGEGVFKSTYTGSSTAVVTGEAGIEFLRDRGFFSEEDSHGLTLWIGCARGVFRLFPRPLEHSSINLFRRKFVKTGKTSYRLNAGRPEMHGDTPEHGEKAWWLSNPVARVLVNEIEGRPQVLLGAPDDQWMCTAGEVEKAVGKLDANSIEFGDEVSLCFVSPGYNKIFQTTEERARIALKIVKGELDDRTLRALSAY